MQKDVGEQRIDARALKRSFHRVRVHLKPIKDLRGSTV